MAWTSWNPESSGCRGGTPTATTPTATTPTSQVRHIYGAEWRVSRDGSPQVTGFGVRLRSESGTTQCWDVPTRCRLRLERGHETYTALLDPGGLFASRRHNSGGQFRISCARREL